MWSSPLSQRKPSKKDEEEAKKLETNPFKKKKSPVSVATAKALCDPDEKREIGRDVCEWCERWIEQLVRNNSYPIQMISNDFQPLLSKMLEASKAMAILTQLRADYKQAFPKTDGDDDLAWLPGLVESDALAKEWCRQMKAELVL